MSRPTDGMHLETIGPMPSATWACARARPSSPRQTSPSRVTRCDGAADSDTAARSPGGDGSAEVVILDLKPNACGILVGGLDQLRNRFELMERAHELATSEAEIDGVRVTGDFGKEQPFHRRVQKRLGDYDRLHFPDGRRLIRRFVSALKERKKRKGQVESLRLPP
jgi:hypothetical protein